MIRPSDYNVFINGINPKGNLCEATVISVGNMIEGISKGDTILVTKGKYDMLTENGVDFYSVAERNIEAVLSK